MVGQSWWHCPWAEEAAQCVVQLHQWGQGPQWSREGTWTGRVHGALGNSEHPMSVSMFAEGHPMSASSRPAGALR